MFSCGVIYLFVSILIILFMITSSRRQNLCLLVSSAFSSIVLIVLIALRMNDIVNFLPIENYFLRMFLQQVIQFDVIAQHGFAFGFFLLIVYIVLFIFSLIFCNIVFPKYNYLVKKDLSYVASKIALIFVNIVLTMVLVLFFLTILNYIYHVERGFIAPLMEIIMEGLLYL